MTRLGPMFAVRELRPGLLALIAALAVATPSQAQQFSTELVRTQDGVTSPAGSLHVSGDKVRMETPDFADGFFLIDGTKPAAYYVRPPTTFMDARQSTALTRLFVPVDPGNPCRQWQIMADIAGLSSQGDWRCEPQAAATIAGHETTAYRATSPSGQSFVGWIDRTNRFPLQIKLDDGALITASNLHDEPQDPSLFELPKGARKFDPQALIDQIKQSDVWVEAPKPTQ